MADIKVKIQLQDTVEDEIDSARSTTSVNNASIQKASLNLFSTLSTKNDGVNMKSWATGSLSLADGVVGGADTSLIEQYGYNGYVFGLVPENKQFEVQLEIIGSNIDSIIVYGDKESNQFPTKAYLNFDKNNIIESDDLTWAIKFDNPSTNQIITFTEWNRSNYNACITFIAVLKNELILDKSWIRDVESLSQSTARPTEIFYGVIPSSASLEIFDRDGEILDYVVDGVIELSNAPTKIIANDNQIYSHLTTDGEYDTETKILNITMDDELLLWENTVLHRGKYNVESLFNFVEQELYSVNYSSNEIFNLFNENLIYTGDWKNSEINIRQFLEGIESEQNLYTNATTLKDFINEICQICQLNVYKNDYGEVKFVSARPIFSSGTDVIKITRKAQMSELKSNPILGNKYINVTYKQNKLSGNSEVVLNETTNVSQDIVSSLTNVEYPQIVIDANGKQFLCFFKTVSSSGTTFQVNDSDFRCECTLTIEGGDSEDDTDDYKKTIYFDPIGVNTTSSALKQDYIFYKDNMETRMDWLFNYSKANSEVLAFTIPLEDNIKSIQLWAGAMVYKLSSEQTEFIDTSKLETKEMARYKKNTYDFDYQDGLLNAHLNYEGRPLYEIIANNIISDYGKGIFSGEISVACLDYYNDKGEKVIDWAKGEVIQVGDIVQVEGSDKYWRVTSRNFRKQGAPFIDLELMEVKEVYTTERAWVTFYELSRFEFPAVENNAIFQKLTVPGLIANRRTKIICDLVIHTKTDLSILDESGIVYTPSETGSIVFNIELEDGQEIRYNIFDPTQQTIVGNIICGIARPTENEIFLFKNFTSDKTLGYISVQNNITIKQYI